LAGVWLAAALLTALCFGTNNTLFKWGLTQRMPTAAIQFLFHATAFFLILGLGLATHSLHAVPRALMIGAVIGCLNATGNIQMTRAYEDGPASLVAPLVACNTVVAVLASAILFQESIAPVHWAGIVMIFGSVLAMQYRPHREGRVESGPWLRRVVLAMLFFGTVGTLMKTATYLELHTFDVLVALYAGGALSLLPQARRSWFERRTVETGAVAGCLSVIGHVSYFYALGHGVASIVFPVVSLNCLVVMAGGYLLFSERLKRYQLVGVATALLGLVLTRI